MPGPLVLDEEYTDAITAVSSALETLNSSCEQYVDELKKISDDGIVKGKTGNSLITYTDKAAEIQSAISAIADCHKFASEHFLTKIDEADQEV